MSNEGRSLVPSDERFAQRLSRRTLCSVAAGLLAGGLAVRLGYLAATSQQPIARRPGQAIGGNDPLALVTAEVQVTGASMAPTLLGPHAELICQACRVIWAANWQPALRPVTPVICWNCGAAVAIDSVSIQPGSLVRLHPLAAQPDSPAIGELVAVLTIAPSQDADGSLSVKRVVAGPGQTITHVRGSLLVDGDPILPETIWIPVHDDAHRRDGQSWWQPHASGTQSEGTEKVAVEATSAGFKFQPIAGTADDAQPPRSRWLVYHHRSVHHGMRPDRIRDDVPGNVSEVRALLPVSRLRLSLRVQARSAVTLEAAFWDGVATRIDRYALPEGVQKLQIVGPRRDATPTAAAGDAAEIPELGPPALGETSPLAVRVVLADVSTGAAELSELQIDRPLQYGIDERLAATRDWPTVLSADQYFVLGDNVPLSIDSRHFGPIARSRIVGLIRPVS